MPGFPASTDESRGNPAKKVGNQKKRYTMKETVIPKAIVDEAIKANGLPSVGKASIREVKKLINDIEKASGTRFVRMASPACLPPR